MQPTDDEIVARLRKGDSRHFTVLVGRYRDRGYALALRILRHPSDAEEALQDAFIRAWRGIARFEGASSFATWFYRILYNVCMTSAARRRNGSPIRHEDPEGIPDAAEEPRLEGDYSGLEMRDLAGLVGEVIATLPPRYASILTLFYLQEMSHAEIAEVTGLPVGTVKTHLFRARALLQRSVQERIRSERITV